MSMGVPNTFFFFKFLVGFFLGGGGGVLFCHAFLLIFHIKLCFFEKQWVHYQENPQHNPLTENCFKDYYTFLTLHSSLTLCFDWRGGERNRGKRWGEI